MKSLVVMVLALWGILVLPDSIQADPLYVGVLEQYHDHWNNENAVPDIRMAFTKSDSGWQAMPSNPSNISEIKSMLAAYPQSVTWTVIYDGQILGKVLGTATGDIAYGTLGKQNVASLDNPIPTITGGIKHFGQWIGEAKYRPLVLVTNQNHSDPEHWTRCDPTLDQTKLALKEFRKTHPELPYCNSIDDAEAKFRPFKDAEVLIDSTYRSKTGEVLLGLYLDPKLYKCDGLIDDLYQEQWYAIKGNDIRAIGENLTPVDAFDLDGGGSSEWIFSYGGYNKDGYVLFWNDFKQKAEYLWNYH